eukprot:s1365_g21.t1
MAEGLEGCEEWKVASFNIRMKTQEPDPNDNWDFRKDALLQELVNSQAAIIGLQEVKPEQLAFLKSSLAEHGFSSVGVGRGANGDDEASPIFYKSAEFQLVREGQRWLSASPATPGSRLEGAGCPRVVTQALLKCCHSGKEIFVFCTHLDHRGMQEAARPFSPGLQIQAAQAEILLKEVEAFCDADVPQLVLGDFNSWPGAGAHPVLLRHGYHEASQGTSAQATFVGFGSGSLLARFQEWMCKVQIDYIFGTKNLELKGYSVHHNTYKAHDGRSRNLSDHCMISAHVRMTRAET